MSIEQSIWQSIIAALRTYVKPIQDAVEEGPGGIVKLLGEASIDTSTSLETLLDGVATQASLIADKTSDGINSPGDVMGLVGPLLTSIETLSKDLSDDVALPLLEHLSLKFIWNLSPQTFTFLVLNEVGGILVILIT